MKHLPLTTKSKIEDFRKFFTSEMTCESFLPGHFYMASPYTKDELIKKNRIKDIVEWRSCGIMWMCCCGMNSMQIAREFNINHSTVFYHLISLKDAFKGYNKQLFLKVKECEAYSNLYGGSIDQRKMKVYISGAISFNPNYVQQFEEAKKTLISLNESYIPVSPVDLPHNHDKSWNSYMREDIKELMNCQAIFLMKGWQNSEGARIEEQLARALNFKIIHELED